MTFVVVLFSQMSSLILVNFLDSTLCGNNVVLSQVTGGALIHPNLLITMFIAVQF